jgi:hypothetical protein
METVPDPSNIETFARVVFNAVMTKNWALVAALAVVGLVFVARKYLAPKVPFLATGRGGALLVMVTSLAGAIANAVLAGAPFNVGLLLKAAGVAFTAAGGFAMAKKLIFGDDAAAVQRVEAAGLAAESKTEVKTPMDVVNGQ